VLAFMAAWYWHDLPPLDKATAYRPRQHLQVLTADGAEIAQFGTERRIFVPIAQAPKLLQDAVLAVEDHEFYNHHGISFKGMARAAWSHATGGIGGGASTITQQVSRTFFLSTRRTIERKLKEALIAWQLESELGKDGILELYLNQIYLGQRAYGYGAAAQVYFGKPLAQLDLAETAMLAGLQQNPIYANPIVNNAGGHQAPALGAAPDGRHRCHQRCPTPPGDRHPAGVPQAQLRGRAGPARGRDGAPRGGGTPGREGLHRRRARLHLGARGRAARGTRRTAPRRDGP
jgi:membrane peptidoglycan carboxypeptidase